jgi:hypothetical protein
MTAGAAGKAVDFSSATVSQGRQIHRPVCQADIGAALFAAYGFILGFENDPDHDGMDDLLMLLEKAQEAAAGQLPLNASVESRDKYFSLRYERTDGSLKGWFNPPTLIYRNTRDCWYGVETLTTPDGKTWMRDTFAVMDDFGDLVEVQR